METSASNDPVTTELHGISRIPQNSMLYMKPLQYAEVREHAPDRSTMGNIDCVGLFRKNQTVEVSALSKVFKMLMRSGNEMGIFSLFSSCNAS